MTAEESRSLKFRRYVVDRGLTNQQIADLLDVSIKTVEGWLASPEAASHRQISAAHFELLRLKTKGQRKPGKDREGKRK